MARVLAPALESFFPAFGVDNVGTFTPVLAGNTIAGTFTYDAANTGVAWTRMGDRVLFNGRVRITAIAVAPTGNLEITGLPFAGASVTGSIAGGCAFGAWTGITLTGGRTQLAGDVLSNATAIRLFESGSNLAAAGVLGGGLVLVGGVADFRFSGQYQVA
jgi:hypothetical protein